MMVSSHSAANQSLLQSPRRSSGSSKDSTAYRNKNLYFDMVALNTGFQAVSENSTLYECIDCPKRPRA